MSGEVPSPSGCVHKIRTRWPTPPRWLYHCLQLSRVTGAWHDPKFSPRAWHSSPFRVTRRFCSQLVNPEIFWPLLLEGFALLARSFAMSSLNFEPCLHSEINKSSINTAALRPTLLSSAAQRSVAAKASGEEGVSLLFSLRQRAGTSDLAGRPLVSPAEKADCGNFHWKTKSEGKC